MKRTCGNCRHAHPMPESLGTSVQCRAHPPALLVTTAGLGTAFPVVPADDTMLCGCWTEAERQAPAQRLVKL